MSVHVGLYCAMMLYSHRHETETTQNYTSADRREYGKFRELTVNGRTDGHWTTTDGCVLTIFYSHIRGKVVKVR